jgi:aldose sugar dehydrogenase
VGKITVDDPRLQDRVADNAAKREIIESESAHREGLRWSAPTLKAPRTEACSLTKGAIFEIFRR